ncbi:MAG: hypothetical protein U5K54_08475 [Cytophagales bacterium]|nr:hypothetical protein [Cytophagales bacterium]
MSWIVFGILFTDTCQSQSLDSIYNLSMAAYKEKNYKEFERLNIEALQIHPSQPSVLYNLAASYALNNKLASSFNALTELISWKADVIFENDSDFALLMDNPEYKKDLQEMKNVFSAPMEKSKVMALMESTYHLEDILYINNKLIVTDVRNGYVLKYDIGSKNTTKVATLEGSALALTTAAEENCVWVSSSLISNYRGFIKKNENKASLVKINIEKNKIIATIEIPDEAIIGSMIRIGDRIYATNSLSSEIIVVDTKLNRVSKKINIDGARSLQGITRSDNEKYVFVADYIVGIAKINLEGVEPVAWLPSKGYLLKGIDGISYVDPNTLIAIQNNSTPHRVIKVSHDNNEVTSILMLDNALPNNGEPTNGTYLKEVGFVYVTNSQWPFYDREGNPTSDRWEPQQIRQIKFD